MKLTPVSVRLATLLLVCLVVAATMGCIATPTPTPASPTAVVPAADTPTPIIIVVTATPAPPAATNTAVPATVTATGPTATAVAPTATTAPAAPTATTKPTSTPVPPTAAPPKPSPTPPCTELPVRGFGKVWAENQSARDYLGCPSYPKSEAGVDFTAQRFENGVIFFTSASGYFDQNSVLVLFGDNKTWNKVVVPADASPAPIAAPPAGKFAPAGRIGWVWQQAAGVRTRLGWATALEKTGRIADGSNGAWQAFSRGYMYWIPWAQPADLSVYVVANYNPYPPGGGRTDWLEFKDTWTP
jgi:hypothetical protein